jgi:hypothetical protein
MISVFQVVFISSLSFFVIRIAIRYCGPSGQDSLTRNELIFSATVIFWTIYFLRTLPFFIYTPTLLAFAALLYGRISKIKTEEIDLIKLIDEILMTMQAGLSFESAAREICSTKSAWNRIFLSAEQLTEEKNTMTNGQNHNSGEIIKVFSFCRLNPTLSYKILVSLRQTLRLREKLRRKQSAITLQSRAQALVSLTLFVVLAISQWFMNPDFQVFLSSTSGRFLFIFSSALTGSGVYSVLKLSRPKELAL